MSLISLGAWRQRAAEQTALRTRLKSALAQAMGLSDDDVVQVTEIACADPGCADIETVVLVMRRGERTRAIRLRRPMDQVSDDDCRHVASEERLGCAVDPPEP